MFSQMMPCPATSPASAVAMLERRAGRPLSASEAYTGQLSGHGTYDYNTILNAMPVWALTHRYGFNVAGRGVGAAVGTHPGGLIGSYLTNAAIYAGLAWLTQKYIANPVQANLMRSGGRWARMSPTAFSLLLGAIFGVVATTTAQFIHRPLAQMMVPQQQKPAQQTVQQTVPAQSAQSQQQQF